MLFGIKDMDHSIVSDYATFLAKTIESILKRENIAGEISVEWGNRNLKTPSNSFEQSFKIYNGRLAYVVIFTIKLSDRIITNYCPKNKDMIEGKSLSRQYYVLSLFYPIIKTWVRKGWIKTSRQ